MGVMATVEAMLQPLDKARLKLLEKRWEQLPASEQTAGQAVGRTFIACGATHGVHEACNFGCTACYLGKTANHQPPLPFAEVKQQLEELREYLGPGGNVQITSGEVTLLPKAELVKIVAQARSLDLSPMVMTHGDVLLHQPEYLDALVEEGGLTKISIHVDTTQRGRKGYSRVDEEEALNPLREAMANMLRASRKRTGRKLKAATTVTVNQHNLKQLPAVLSAFFSQLDAFRILSFQPQAKTGRTRLDTGVDGETVWTEIEGWLGQKLNPKPVQFGHAACNRVAMLLVLETGKQSIVLQAAEPDNETDAKLLRRFLRDFSGVVFNDRPFGELLGKCLGVLVRKPWWLIWVLQYTVQRSWRERKHWGSVFKALITGKLRIRPCVLVVHAFMSRDELTTAEGQERLKACMFKLPVDGEMVSMCEMNGSSIRESTYVV